MTKPDRDGEWCAERDGQRWRVWIWTSDQTAAPLDHDAPNWWPVGFVYASTDALPADIVWTFLRGPTPLETVWQDSPDRLGVWAEEGMSVTRGWRITSVTDGNSPGVIGTRYAFLGDVPPVMGPPKKPAPLPKAPDGWRWERDDGLNVPWVLSSGRQAFAIVGGCIRCVMDTETPGYPDPPVAVARALADLVD